jgi:hypothetical protein
MEENILTGRLGCPYAKKSCIWNLDPYLIKLYKIKIDHRPKCVTIKYLEENIGANLCDLGLGNDFLRHST